MRPFLSLVLCLLALLASGCASLPPEGKVQRVVTQGILASPDTPLGRLAADSTPSKELTGFRLLPIGAFALDTRLALARRAAVSLDVQYYQIHNDATGRYLLRTLRDAAQRGVRVRLLMDDLYTEGEDELLLGLAAHPNVEVRLFNPFPGGRDGGVLSRFAASLADFSRVNHRMHNKLFIADGAMAVAGGRNIGDEYFMRDGVTNFVDLDTFITGALVPQLQFLFDYYWNSPYVYPLHAIVPPEDDAAALQALFDRLTGERSTPPPPPPATDVLGYGPIGEELDDGRIGLIWAEADAYADPPDKIAAMMEGGKRERYLDEEAVRFNVLEQLRAARTEVQLTSPYLIPGSRGIAVMKELRERGVKVRLLTNSLAATDEPLVHIGYKRYRKQMLKLGVELYELSPTRVKRSWKLGMFGSTRGRLHAKTAVIDRRKVFIGSMNFDPRSEIHNTEMGLIIDSPQLAREMLRLMDLDKLQASYKLRLGRDGETLQWLSLDDEQGEMVQEDEPDADFWQQLWLDLIAPLAPEELL